MLLKFLSEFREMTIEKIQKDGDRKLAEALGKMEIPGCEVWISQDSDCDWCFVISWIDWPMEKRADQGGKRICTLWPNHAGEEEPQIEFAKRVIEEKLREWFDLEQARVAALEAALTGLTK